MAGTYGASAHCAADSLAASWAACTSPPPGGEWWKAYDTEGNTGVDGRCTWC